MNVPLTLCFHVLRSIDAHLFLCTLLQHMSEMHQLQAASTSSHSASLGWPVWGGQPRPDVGRTRRRHTFLQDQIVAAAPMLAAELQSCGSPKMWMQAQPGFDRASGNLGAAHCGHTASRGPAPAACLKSASYVQMTGGSPLPSVSRQGEGFRVILPGESQVAGKF